MAQVDIDIVGQQYDVACRDGEEAHLISLGKLVSAKAEEAGQAVGKMSEARQLLFAALLLADDLIEARRSATNAADPDATAAVERLADRLEALADRLEAGAPKP